MCPEKKSKHEIFQNSWKEPNQRKPNAKLVTEQTNKNIFYTIEIEKLPGKERKLKKLYCIPIWSISMVDKDFIFHKKQNAEAREVLLNDILTK